MASTQSNPTSTPLPRTRTWYGLAMGAALLLIVVGVLVRVVGLPGTDTGTPGAKAPTDSVGTSVASQPGPQWHQLNAEQQDALKPLATTWNSLALAHKNKWIALAKTFPSRSTSEQARLQDRMAQWAALTPREREVARLNFAETKKIRSGDLAASWAAYQELSPEEKSRLAAQATQKPLVSTIAIAPTPNDKITPVPITRHTHPSNEQAMPMKPQLDPNTLLPKMVPPPVAIDTPPAPVEAPSTPGITSDTLSPN